MKSTLSTAARLEDLPNIGRSIAADLRKIGINTPAQLRGRSPLDVFRKLQRRMGRRHDPCVLYTLLAAAHYLKTGQRVMWWTFTQQGKSLLRRRK